MSPGYGGSRICPCPGHWVSGKDGETFILGIRCLFGGLAKSLCGFPEGLGSDPGVGAPT